MNKREAVTQVIPRSAVNNIANIEDDDIKPVEKAKKIEIFKPRRQDSLPYGNCKVKMMGKYKVRKRNNGYNIQLHDEFGVTKEVFDVWKSESLDRAFEKGSIDPFISCAQSDNQKRSKRNQKAQHKDMLRKIQRRFRKQFGKTLTINSLKKTIKVHSETEARKLEIEEGLKEIRADETVAAKYEGTKFYDELGDSFAKLKDGTTLKFDQVVFDGDSLMQLIPDDIEMNHLWEMYGEMVVVDVKKLKSSNSKKKKEIVEEKI